MDHPLSDPFATCRTALAGDRPHRAWSVIVTIFGDLAQAPESRMSGAMLGQITGHIGIRPEAVRVALHRLRRDNWIESRREGRGSVHRLTDHGRQQSAAASPRIYGPGLPAGAPVHLVVAEEGAADGRAFLDALCQSGAYAPLGNAAIVGTGPPPTEAGGLFVVTPAHVEVPDWLRHRVCPPELLNEYKAMERALDVVTGELAAAPALTPPKTAALRTLVVHSWRRLLLRHPELPAAFFPADWPGERCRAMVRTILSHLSVDARALLAPQDQRTTWP